MASEPSDQRTRERSSEDHGASSRPQPPLDAAEARTPPIVETEAPPTQIIKGFPAEPPPEPDADGDTAVIQPSPSTTVPPVQVPPVQVPPVQVPPVQVPPVNDPPVQVPPVQVPPLNAVRTTADSTAADSPDSPVSPVASVSSVQALRSTACPYPGLRGFDETSEQWFFGRARVVTDLIARVRARVHGGGPLVLVGASGSGKSSLLRAGLLPALTRRAVPGSNTWPQLVMTPGEHPLDTLVQRVTEVAGMPAMGRLLRDSLNTEPERLAEILHELLASRRTQAQDWPAAQPDEARPGIEPKGDGTPARPRMVIAVDQFEEVFTLCSDPVERETFIRALCATAAVTTTTTATGGLGPTTSTGEPAAIVLIGLRADFYGECAAYPELVDVLQVGQVVVGPMTAGEIRETVVNPVRAADADVEPGLVELVLRDLGAATESAGFVADPGSLPLLAHALRATWFARAGAMLTVADYLRIGGLTGAIAQTAEAAYAALDAEAQQAARPLLMRMIRLGENGADTRRRVRRQTLLAEVPATKAATVLDTLVDARLVEADADGESDSLQIAHEALLRSWPRLREWMDMDRASGVALQQLHDAAEVWERGGRDPSYLFSGTRLAAARDWVEAQPGQAVISASAQTFYDESIRVESAQRRATIRRTRWLRQLAAALAVLLGVAGALAGLTYQQSESASTARDRALSQRIASQADNARRDNPALAAQLSLVAYRTADTPEARGAVLSSFNGGSGVPRRLLNHTGAVGTVAFSPDGRLIATGSDDWTAAIWDADDLNRVTPLATLPNVNGGGHSRAVKSVAFSRDSTLLATGGSDRLTKLWDVADPASPRLLATLPEATSEVYGLAFSPEADWLAVGGYGNSARIFDVSDPAEPEPLGQLYLHLKPIVTLDFSPNGQFLAAGDEGGSALVWYVQNPGNPRPAVLLVDKDGPTAAGAGTIRSVSWADDTTIYTAGEAGLIRKFTGEDVLSLTHTTTAGGGSASLTSIDADAATGLVAAGSFNFHGAAIVDPDAGQNSLTFLQEGPVTWAVAFNPDGRRLATGSNDGALRIWEMPGPALIGRTGDMEDAAIHDATGASGGGPPAARENHDRAAFGHGTVATVTNQAVELWDVTDIYAPEALSTIDDAIVDEFDPLTRTAFSPDGEVLAVSTGKNVALYDVTDPRDPSKITTVDTPPGGASYVTFSPDGRLMAVGDLGAPPAPEFERFVEIWDVSDIASPIRLDSVVAHRAFIREIMFSPDGRLLVTVADRSAKLWDVSDPSAIAPLAELPWIPGGAWTVAFAPDGQTLAVGGGGPFTTLWDVSRPAEPVELADLPGHVNVVYSLVFSPDGTRLATGSGDNTVRLWDVTDPEDPELLARLTRSAGLEGGITRILFAHDGGSLVATINTAPAALWDLDIDRVAERICTRAGVGITEDEWRRFLPDLTYDPACD